MLKMYDFECQDCGHKFEVMTDKPERYQECKACGGFNSRRSYTKSQFQVTGKGAYDNRMKV